MYQTLSMYYDALVTSDEALSMWVEWIKRENIEGKIVELASGTGELAFYLHQNNYDIIASDYNEGMLQQIMSKYPQIPTKKLDMRDFHEEELDAICCFCDSINYLMHLDEVEQMIVCVKNSLKIGGKFLFDIHSVDRLEEFSDVYIEDGVIMDVEYQWTIASHQDEIHQHFVFYQEPIVEEFHVQKVYPLPTIVSLLKKHGFQCNVTVDFTLDVSSPGERYCISARRIV